MTTTIEGSKGCLDKTDFETLERRLDFIFESLLVQQSAERNRDGPVHAYQIGKELQLMQMLKEFKKRCNELKDFWYESEAGKEQGMFQEQ
jgi:hypothetical protein